MLSEVLGGEGNEMIQVTKAGAERLLREAKEDGFVPTTPVVVGLCRTVLELYEKMDHSEPMYDEMSISEIKQRFGENVAAFEQRMRRMDKCLPKQESSR